MMMIKDRKLVKCGSKKRLYVDRLSNLPDDILGQILSNLPTKDVAATQVLLSKRMRHAFSLITNVDLDDSPISHCVNRSHLVERFPLLESFIDNVFKEISASKQPLTRFRLWLGSDKNTHFSYHHPHCVPHRKCCTKECCPSLEPTRLDAWLSFPFSYYCSLRELDMAVHVKNTCDIKGLFTCQSLEVLKMNFNLEINDDEIPLIPNLKLLQISSLCFKGDDFVARLISSCPALEDLSIADCVWMMGDRVTISSSSLRRLKLVVVKDNQRKNSELVVIDTPHLEYLDYLDTLAYSYSVAHMELLVEARIDINLCGLVNATYEDFLRHLSLVRAVSIVQHLSLLYGSTEHMFYTGEFDLLPMFPNLRTLELDELRGVRWDVGLLIMLHCSPLLETLIFPNGFSSFDEDYYYEEMADLEAEGWKTIDRIPSCFLTHLKQIEISSLYGYERDINMIKFLLGNTSVLKEFVIRDAEIAHTKSGLPPNNIDEFFMRVEELPRASNSCSITLHRFGKNDNISS